MNASSVGSPTASRASTEEAETPPKKRGRKPGSKKRENAKQKTMTGSLQPRNVVGPRVVQERRLSSRVFLLKCALYFRRAFAIYLMA